MGREEADALERATKLAERYGAAIVRISGHLNDATLSAEARIRRARVTIAGLESVLKPDA